MPDIEFALTKLIRPSGAIKARWIGAIGDTGMIHISYWLLDPATARNKPVTDIARHCPKHCLCYLTSDYPNGCPECNKEN